MNPPEQTGRATDDAEAGTSMRPTGEPELRTVAMPADANPSGDIFGGWVMAQMDIAGGIAASQRARGRVVTAAVDAMSFRKPVRVGDVVSIYCSAAGHGRSSMRFHVATWVQRRRTTLADVHEELVTEAVFTFVAVDGEGRPRPLPD
ncbi:MULTISPECIES: acyl-CoA thioesterase [Tistrella]|jgi:acyl-CoA thioesterase YciA|uniref:Acyl-CoA thioesterase n=2 Tax=Tistrella TaxID=171436 RepID=A0ABU9YHM6_9PROT|nr:acyl-CoA thioesterase [Tistrella bauzanensis]